MIELFIVAYLTRAPCAYREHSTLTEACVDAKENNLEPPTVFRLTMRQGKISEVQEIECKWVEASKAHWEAADPANIIISSPPNTFILTPSFSGVPD